MSKKFGFNVVGSSKPTLFNVDHYSRIADILCNWTFDAGQLDIQRCEGLKAKELKKICEHLKIASWGSKKTMLLRLKSVKYPPKLNPDFVDAMLPGTKLHTLKLDGISDFSLDELRQIAKKFNLKSEGSKKQLIDRIVRAKNREVEKKFKFDLRGVTK